MDLKTDNFWDELPAKPAQLCVQPCLTVLNCWTDQNLQGGISWTTCIFTGNGACALRFFWVISMDFLPQMLFHTWMYCSRSHLFSCVKLPNKHIPHTSSYSQWHVMKRIWKDTWNRGRSGNSMEIPPQTSYIIIYIS